MRTEDISYYVGDLLCRGYLAAPDTPGKHPGILVAHTGLGLNDHTIERTRLLADMGYTAFALDLYGERKVAYDVDGGRRLSAPLADLNVLRSRLDAGLGVLMSRPGVDPARIGAIGFCYGGLAVLELARSGAPVAATVTFHGLLRNNEPGSAGNIRGSVLVCTGADDPHVPPADVAAFQEEMRQTKVPWQVIVYGGAKHAFTRPSVTETASAGYHAHADRDSWAAMQALFRETFATPGDH